MDSLEGLSVGDAWGETFFMSFELAAQLMASEDFGGPPYDFQDGFILREFVGVRRLPPRRQPWPWTDDTALALEIVGLLAQIQEMDGEELALRFAKRYRSNPLRGFGGAMHDLLPQLALGNWKAKSGALFQGTGSFGNGAAMRVAPLGAYFADDLPACVKNARLSSLVTHAHPEGVAGGVAVAVAASLAARARENRELLEPETFFDEVLKWVPSGEVKRGIEHARKLPENTTSEEAADILGSGQEVSAQDTVPFCLWCAAHALEHFDEALWLTVAGLGDRDTTCAIVGGIVASFTGAEAIPEAWKAAREALPEF